ncbi:MAG: hypothetical protein R6U26_00625 [Candidatus Undinarchaeales archaeon]
MAARDKIFGGLLSLLAVLVAVIYFYGMWYGYALLAVQVVVSVIFIGLMAMIFWMGYTIATTPTIEEIKKRKK